MGFIVSASVVLLLGAAAGYKIVDRTFRAGVYTPANAPALLHAGEVESWNAVRRLAPEWRPSLRECVFDEAVLPDVDFKNADLTKSSFKRAYLDGTDFSGAVLVDADFSEASLRRASFDGARIERTKFDRAMVEGATFERATPPPSAATPAAPSPSDSAVANEAPHPELKHQRGNASEMSPPEFERHVAGVLARLNMNVEVSDAADDYGIDIVATQDTPIGPIRVVVQVKRVSDATRPVGLEAVRALAGVLNTYPSHIGMLVTNGRFTPGAHEFAARNANIRLIDGDELSRLEEIAG